MAEPECERAPSCLLLPDMYFPRGATAFLRTANTFLEKLVPPSPFPSLLPPPRAPSSPLPRGLHAHSLPPAGLPVDGGYDYIWGPEPPRPWPGEAVLFLNLHARERALEPRWRGARHWARVSSYLPEPSPGRQGPQKSLPGAPRSPGNRTGGVCTHGLTRPPDPGVLTVGSRGLPATTTARTSHLGLGALGTQLCPSGSSQPTHPSSCCPGLSRSGNFNQSGETEGGRGGESFLRPRFSAPVGGPNDTYRKSRVISPNREWVVKYLRDLGPKCACAVLWKGQRECVSV